jgi:hypothetical protein
MPRFNRAISLALIWTILVVHAATSGIVAAELPPNQWVELARDPAGGRRGCAIRYAPGADRFFLWGFMNADPDLLQEEDTMAPPEYDTVSFHPDTGKWENWFPDGWRQRWASQLPRTYYPRTYSGITSGSERSLLRPPPGFPDAPSRPDPNLVFDQVAYRPVDRSLFYFTGGLTLAYDVQHGRWTDLRPPHSPPPVTCGAVCYDPVHDEMILFGGGHVAEAGPGGRVAGYTGMWAYSYSQSDWRRVETPIQPPPRMSSPMVCDMRRGTMVLFGGDAQSHYLADTWLFDLATRRWRPSRAAGGPPPRGGHFATFDPKTGWVIVGGGYNQGDLSDMWAYDGARDTWFELPGKVPTGFTLSADFAPERRLIVLVTNTKRPGDSTRCNELFPVRTTYAYRLDEQAISPGPAPPAREAMSRRPPEDRNRPHRPDAERTSGQQERLKNLPANRWVLLDNPGFVAPARTWGSATFDTNRGRILLWGGGHCGYGGSDVDEYLVAEHTWVGSVGEPEFLERTWNLGVREAGVTFRGAPWATHGRKVFAYDPVLRKMLCVRSILLTAGYDPAALADLPADRRAQAGAKVVPPTAYKRAATFAWDPATTEWELLGPGVVGLDHLVTTPRGVMGVNVDWPARLKDSGYHLDFNPADPPVDNTVFQYDGVNRRWKRLGEPQVSPQNLYEMTGLAYDSRRDRVMLHGGGPNRDELWSFDVERGRWTHLAPKVDGPEGAPPVCNREMVYVPRHDVLLTYGRGRGRQAGPQLWIYHGAENAWRRIEVDLPEGMTPSAATSATRALVYDAERDVALLVLAADGNQGSCSVYALRYAPEGSQ